MTNAGQNTHRNTGYAMAKVCQLICNIATIQCNSIDGNWFGIANMTACFDPEPRHELHLWVFDAPVFNRAAQAGIRLSNYLGMKPELRRSVVHARAVVVEWQVYRFAR
ncbi:MAG: hypothetical protein WC740_06645 [Verrucomicrobiia bacterium]